VTFRLFNTSANDLTDQPFSWRSGLFFLTAGAGLFVYFQYEKGRMDRKRVAEAAKGVGRPKVGGKFELLDQEGRIFTDQDMKGKYALVSEHLNTLRCGNARNLRRASGC